MGVVYRARQSALNRIVAVKVLLRAQFASAEERLRFQRESQAAARLKHPGIVGIYDVGEDEDVPWFSMEYITGLSMEQALRGQPMDSREAARCVQQISVAIQHAHDHGVLHRDLKPSNILLDDDGTPRITDFGIARIITGDTTTSRRAELTRTGQSLGSPGYAAPEQALAGTADARTDVYGLGALLYHLLTGRSPFQGPTLDAILVQLRENDPLPPHKLNPSVPRDLETICLKCLRKQPDARYTTAAAVADDLSRFLDGKPILARPLSPIGKVWRWAWRHPGIAALLVLVALLITGMIGGSLAFARHQSRLEQRSSLLSEARSLRQQRLAGSRNAALAKLREAWAIQPSDDIRNEAIACLSLPDIGPVYKLMADSPKAKALDPTRSADDRFIAAFEGNDVVVREVKSRTEKARLQGHTPGSLMKLDDHGARIAIAAPVSQKQKNQLQLIQVSDGHLIATCEHPMALASIDWSGQLIATGCANRFIYIWDDGGHLKHRLTGHDADPIHVSFRPRSQELASTSRDTQVRLWHAARGEQIVRRVTAHDPHTALWWSADGSRLVAGHVDGSADVFPLEDPHCFQLLAPPQEEPHSENHGSAALSPDGRLAAVMNEGSCRVWDLHLGRVIHSIPKAPGQWLSALFSSDGLTLWVCGWDMELSAYPIIRDAAENVTAGTPVKLLNGYGNLLRALSTDGRHLVLSNNGTGEFTVFTPATKRAVSIKHPSCLATAIGHDGTWLATSSYQTHGCKIWSLPDGKLQRTLLKDEIVMQTIVSPDGTRLLCDLSKAMQSFRTSDWSQEAMPATTRLQGIALHPNQRQLISLGDDYLRVLDSHTLKEQTRLMLPPHVGWLGDGHAIFDADGSHLIVHTALGSVCRWDLHALNEELNKMGISSNLADKKASK